MRPTAAGTVCREFVRRTSFQTERDIIVLDSEGRLIAESSPPDDRQRGRDRRFFDHEKRLDHPVSPEHFAPIVASGLQVGSVAVAARGRGGFGPLLLRHDDTPPPLDAEPPLTRFADAVRRTLTIVGLVAGAAGILLVVVMSRRMLSSISSLTAAARGLGSGDLSQRAAVRGNDEIADLGRTFNSMADALEHSERQRRDDGIRRGPRTADAAVQYPRPYRGHAGRTSGAGRGCLGHCAPAGPVPEPPGGRPEGVGCSRGQGAAVATGTDAGGRNRRPGRDFI